MGTTSESNVTTLVTSNPISSSQNPNSTGDNTTCYSELSLDWRAGPGLPAKLEEVAAGRIGNWIFVIGNPDARTFKIDVTDIDAGWSSAPNRPYQGDHIVSLVIGNQFWAFGGLGTEIGDKVQVYDPETNSWDLKKNIPKTVGSGVGALIDGWIYLCEGLKDTWTVGTGECFKCV